MKKLLMLLATATALMACKKDHNQTLEKLPPKEKLPVNIGVEPFKQSVTDLSVKEIGSTRQVTATSTELSYSKLTYIVFDSVGNFVSRLEQKTAEPNHTYRISQGKKTLINTSSTFGSFRDSLQAGKYTLVVGAGSNQSTWNYFGVYASGTAEPVEEYIASALSSTYFVSSARSYLDDSFLYKGELTVGQTNPVKTISLNRIVGKMTFNIEDNIPANVTQITLQLTNTYDYYNFILNRPMSRYTTSQKERGYYLTADNYNKPNQQFELFSHNGSTPYGNLKILVFQGSTLLFTREIPNIMINLNKNTLVTGKLFTPNPSAFNMVVNDTWGTGSTIKF